MSANGTTTKLIKVTGVSPYSVYSGQQRYSFNKGVNSTMFVKGNTYSVNVKVGSKGGEYIDSVSNDLGVLAGDATPAEPTPSLNPNINKSNSFTKDDYWRNKEQRDLENQPLIRKSGLIQAAVQAVATHASSVEDLEAKAITLAEHMLTWVNNTTSTKQ